MSLFPARSTLGLLGHELRLTWRVSSTAAGKRRRRGLIILGLVMTALAIPGYFLAKALAHFVTLTPEVVLGVDMALGFLFTLMLSQTLSSATLVFFERGDLDLLLSSPVPAQRVLTVRCVNMAITAMLLFALIATPFVLPNALFGHWRWLMVYPVLLSLALVATAIGLAIAMSLFKLIGPRRTKTLAQVMAAIIGAGFFLVAQIRNILPRDQLLKLSNRYLDAAHAGWFVPSQPASWPAQALFGDPVIAGAIFAASLLIFLVVVRSLGASFAENAAAAAGVGIGRGKAARGKIKGFEGGPFGAMLRKELRLIRRDVALLSQVLLRVLYLIVLAFVMLNRFRLHSDVLVASGAAGLVFIAGQLTGTLAWITVSAEEALPLLASAPAKPWTLRRAKLTAALIPVGLLLVIPLGALTWLSPWAGAVTTLGCLAVSVSDGLIAIWYERPAKRTELRRRRSSSLVSTFSELGIALFWGGATWLGVMHIPWAGVPAILGLVLLIALRRPERSFTETLQTLV